MNRALEAIVGLGVVGITAITAAAMGPEDAKEVAKAFQTISTDGYAPLIRSALPFVAYLGTAASGVWSIKRAIKGEDRYARVS